MDFHESLKRVRIARGNTQKEVADAIGIKVQTYQKYEYGSMAPSILLAIKFADFFNVSLDVLAGRE